ncbi:MAG: integrase [Pseudonocardiales bacterium]|nr:integrase [Pseudonocardiales bacterium]
MQDQHEGRRPYRGRRPSAARIRFLELLDSGMRSLEASREVGVNERTGRDWAKGIVKSKNRRYTFDGVLVWSVPDRPKPPREEKVISARFLSVEERIEIADLYRQGLSVRQIARRASRAPSTISRELRRNAHPGSGDYRPWAAQRRAARRRARPKPGRIAQNEQLRGEIAEGLRRRWSPEQISRRLRLQFPEQPEMHVTHETIYQALYVQGRGELRRELARCLRTGRAVRRPQRRPDERRSRFQSPMLMISERPAEVEDRAVPGHWEGDLILGARHQSAIATLVERSTRYVMLAHLPHGYAAEQVKDALVTTIAALPAHLRRSLTWDQGTEMGAHHLITMATDMPIYFCDPGSPWQRGSNENTNGLLRQYFPKGSDLTRHSPDDLAAVAAELNGRPRKTLGWATPAERLAALLHF